MSHDLLIAGAGLSGALIALAVRDRRPDARIVMLDARSGPSDQHTWSCHDTDLSPEWLARLSPIRRGEWTDQEVAFPDHSRRLTTGYGSIEAGALIGLLQGVDLRWNTHVATLDDTGATLTDGSRIEAACVIDARGAVETPHLTVGFQKFVGVEIETDAPHGVERPMIMDATVPQMDGYRFIYLLPFSPTRILIEDTRYSDGGDLDDGALAQASLDYAARRGWTGQEMRRERGILPIALAHDAIGFWRDHAQGAVPVGLGAGLFHPVTGYSLPYAAQVADAIAARDLTTASARRAVRGWAIDRADRDRFLRLLNRMLFRGCPPDRRYRLLQRFYRLPQPLIERFYAGRLTLADRLRIVTGRPPIPLSQAVRCLPERPLLQERA
ncbi:lycopene beta-cyclase CrtY [Paracoccus zeaxanthinifaciens]|uniref:Lycopene cyclase n=1 Tax=Flavobacterium sp. ATCC 21588 TaxID=50286 RepID=P94791_9FLAO|nr:lycopene beta-cyclase CrtY [Paracoccus zeaxanthinifaciens]AAC44851.1 lycopene cyclase [Flavobacterium sp. ATCC 21588]